jgi:hypothetical protein
VGRTWAKPSELIENFAGCDAGERERERERERDRERERERERESVCVREIDGGI